MRRLVALSTLLLAAATGASHAEPPPRFPPDAVWHRDVRDAPLHPDSAAMIATWNSLGGFGFGRMQIDFGMKIVHAGDDAPMRPVVAYPSASGYYLPDCEAPGTPMPVPADAEIEWSDGPQCDNANGDCHLLVVRGDRLYEAYRANVVAAGVQSQCLVIWKLAHVYPPSGRGEHCTSADAAGFPIAPLLFNADEVHAAMQRPDGDLGHALRFILPNARMASTIVGGRRYGQYVRPASHAGGPTGPEGTIPYGSRLRLRADFPVHLYPAAAQVVLRTMQRYGIVLSDGGNIALTAESDRYTTVKWSTLGLGSRVFDQAVPSAPVRATDFAVVDTGPRVLETWDCVRNAEPPDPHALQVRRGRPTRHGTDLVTLVWQGGGASVDVWRNATLVATAANTGTWQGKATPGDVAPWRVCDAGTTTCTDAAYAVRDAWTHAPVRPGREAPVPSAAPPRRATTVTEPRRDGER